MDIKEKELTEKQGRFTRFMTYMGLGFFIIVAIYSGTVAYRGAVILAIKHSDYGKEQQIAISNLETRISILESKLK